MIHRIIKIIPIIFLLGIILFSGCIQEEPNAYNPYKNPEGLIGCWMFEEQLWNEAKNWTTDCSPKENHGIINNISLVQNNIRGTTCSKFQTIDDYIQIQHEDYQIDQLSIEMWVKSAHPGDDQAYLLSKGSNNCSGSSYAVTTDTNHGIIFYVNDGTTLLKSPNPGSTIWDDNWHHIVGTYDRQTIRLFIDGKEIDQGTQGSINITYNLPTGNDLIIGNYLGTCRRPYQGLIDNVMIWDRPLSPEEINDHYRYAIQSTDSSTKPQMVSLSEARLILVTYLDSFTQDDIIIIKGSRLPIQDNLVLSTIATQMENTEEIQRIQDTNIDQSILSSYPLIVVMGSQQTNSFSDSLISSDLFYHTSSLMAPGLFVQFGTHATTNQEILIVTTLSEKENNKNYAAEKSPLNGLIDKKFIPAIATSTSIIILYLWSIIGNTISEFIFDFISEHITERKIRKLRKYSTKRSISKKQKIIHELLALLFAILVFSLALSWTWSANMNEFRSLILINLGIISLVFLIREGIRVRLSKTYDIGTAHVFWPFGSLLTLGSTILGNTFSLASFTMLSNENDQKMYGKMYYFIFRILYLICIICFITNFFYPSIFFQMTYIFIIMSLFIDMTPLEPMDGKDVKIWNKKKWIIFYVLVIFSYLIMNFSIYITI